MWVGTYQGIHQFDYETGRVVKKFKSNENDPKTLHGKEFCTLLEDSDGNLWIGSHDKGLFCLDLNGNFTHFKNTDSPNSLTDNKIHSMIEDDQKNLWITTPQGLNCFNPTTKTFTRHQHLPNQPDKVSLSGNYVVDIFQDELGVIWICEIEGVLNKIDNGSQKFQRYENEPGNLNSLSKGSYIGNVIEDRDGLIWIAIGGAGLDCFDRKTSKFTHYHHNPKDPNSLPEPSSQAILEEKDGTFWVATQNWIALLDKEKGHFVKKYPVKFEPSTPMQDPENPDFIWFGSWGGGLIRFDKSKGRAKYFLPDAKKVDKTPSHQIMTTIYYESGFLWLVTFGGGLDKFDTKTEEVVAKYKSEPRNPNTLNDNNLNNFYIDSKKRYWVSSSTGFHRFYPTTGKFKRFTKQNGLFPMSSATQIIEDEHGFLWIAGHGSGEIAKFNPETKESKLYSIADGVGETMGIPFPPLKTRDKRIWFLGPAVINSFSPENIHDSNYHPPVFLTSLTQGGKEFIKGKALERLDKIKLDWKNNFFEFEFAALNYRHAKKNQYRYIMEGLDKDWYESGAFRRGRYTALPTGHYVFKVQGSNNDGVWSSKIMTLEVEVVPAWWQTNGFRFSLFCFLVLVLFFGFNWYNRTQKLILEREES